jgi:hypothetical protein
MGNGGGNERLKINGSAIVVLDTLEALHPLFQSAQSHKQITLS